MASISDYVDHYIAEGERLRLSGVEPIASQDELIASYPPLRAYLHEHLCVLHARGVVPEEIDAGAVLIERLSTALPAGGETIGGEGDLLRDAAARLRQVHDAARWQLRTPESAPQRARLGIDRPLKSHSLTALLRAIDQTLGALREEPELFARLRLIPADIEELSAMRRNLGQLRRTPVPSRDRTVATRLQLALDAYFSSLAAAISAAFPPEDPRCVAGLGLMPRLADRPRTRSSPLRPWRGSYPGPDD